MAEHSSQKRSSSAPHEPPVRVAMLGCLPPQRGISTYCLELAAAVSRHVELEFVNFKHMYPAWLYPGREKPLDHTFPDEPVSQFRVREILTWYNPFTWFWEGLFTDADLLHVQFWSIPLLPITLVVVLMFRARGKPVVLTIHNVTSHDEQFLYSSGLGLLVWLSQAVVVHTSAQVLQMRGRYPRCREKLHQIPHGVLSTYRDKALGTRTAREYLGLPLGIPVVLFFGAIRPYKGLVTLLEAFGDVVARLPDAMLLVAGKPWGPWYPYQQVVEKNGIAGRVVTKLDYIPSSEVKWYFAAADLVALPYRNFDSQSGVALATIGCHKPLVASSVGGLDELVSNRRFLIPPDDPAAWSSALIEALEDTAVLESLARDSALLARRLSWDTIAPRLNSLYTGLLSGEEPAAMRAQRSRTETDRCPPSPSSLSDGVFGDE